MKSNPDNRTVPCPQGTRDLTRRTFLGMVAAGLAVASKGAPDLADSFKVELPPLHSKKTEAKETTPAPSLPDGEKVGFAVVGLGHLAIDQILPAFGRSKYAKVTAFVSGHRDKARKLAAQHGVPESSIFDYGDFERLAGNPDVKVIYVVLPNGMHAEYTVRAAKIGKHVLCEKPMAANSAEASRMIAACRDAGVKLMIGYRSQYEPMDRAIVKAIRSGRLGRPLQFTSSNGQDEGDPTQWRLNRKLAGGGPLFDVGIYCINAARFLTGEEPSEVSGQTFQIPDDPRFREVESSVQFMLRFPSGFSASCSAAYDCHRSQYFRIEGSDAWMEMNPAFAYDGLRLREGRAVDGVDTVTDIDVPAKDQFATELDHMASCVISGRDPYTRGEEGLQDMKIMEAIYESALTGNRIRLQSPGPTRGPEPDLGES